MKKSQNPSLPRFNITNEWGKLRRITKEGLENLAMKSAIFNLLSSEFAAREIVVQLLTSGEVLLPPTGEQTND